jgi:hypothetical protein
MTAVTGGVIRVGWSQLRIVHKSRRSSNPLGLSRVLIRSGRFQLSRGNRTTAQGGKDERKGVTGGWRKGEREEGEL